jgi:hypothetical protein
MMFTPRARQLALTVHVMVSVGWFGAVCAFLAIAVLGATNSDPLVVRGAYLALEPVGMLVIVLFALASLATGILQGLGTHWGLLRHYWVAIKLWLTVFATAVLLIHTRLIGTMAAAAHNGQIPATLDGTRTQLVVATLGGAIVLTVIIGLSILKPRGLTRRGLHQTRPSRVTGAAPRGRP